MPIASLFLLDITRLVNEKAALCDHAAGPYVYQTYTQVANRVNAVASGLRAFGIPIVRRGIS